MIDSKFIRVKGKKLVVRDEDREIMLRGMNFVNDVDWADYTWIMESLDHSEPDFQRIRNMGMNVIRFMLDYRFFEDDDQPCHYQQQGWDWLDLNIQWARKYGIYLILDMQIPFGVRQVDESGAWLFWRWRLLS